MYTDNASCKKKKTNTEGYRDMCRQYPLDFAESERVASTLRCTLVAADPKPFVCSNMEVLKVIIVKVIFG